MFKESTYYLNVVKSCGSLDELNLIPINSFILTSEIIKAVHAHIVRYRHIHISRTERIDVSNSLNSPLIPEFRSHE